jgi:transposase
MIKYGVFNKRNINMPYRFGDREQNGLFPQCIGDYVKPGDPVRAYDAIVESMDFSQLGIELNEDKVGNPEYDPVAMMKLLLYGYSYGIRSSRKLERALYHNVSFMWLMGGLKPDHKTIAEFRRKNKGPLKKVLKQCARMCIRLNLIAGNTLFVDGSKIRANASIKNTWDKAKCEKYLKKIDTHIESILSECDKIDEREQGQESLVEMEKELKDKENLKSEVEKILKELEDEEKKSKNTTDAECTRINSIQGSHAGYNVQSVVDEKHGLIVNSDVVRENNDLNQFANQIDQANEILGKKCDTASADSGYANTDELEKIDNQEIKVIVPSQRQASKRKVKPFDKANFQYDKEKNCFLCPEGQVLKYTHFDKRKKHKAYVITDRYICLKCCHFGKCTSSKYGRKVIRLRNEEMREKLEEQYKQPESQAIYKLRKQRVELPYGHIKRNLMVNAFLLRGLDGVKAEMSILASCFNISRMITLLGVEELVEKLAI